MNRYELRKSAKLKHIEDKAKLKVQQNEKAKESLKDILLLAKNFDDVMTNVFNKGENNATKTE